MDINIHLDLNDEETEYIESITDDLAAALERSIKESVGTDPEFILQKLSQTLVEDKPLCKFVQGFPIKCCDGVKLAVGPVMGEVTSEMAIIMLEIKSSKGRKAEIICDLYRKSDRKKVYSLEKEFLSRTPQVFILENLEPGTEYETVFHGICSEDAAKVFTRFKTKPDVIKQFKILALSCDRPDRMLLGQKNPWYEIAGKTYNADVILHLGDQVYNKGEDSDHTCALFGSEFQQVTDPRKKKQWMKRAQELLAKKYRDTWNKLKTRECLQQGCHLMIWSDNDVANDFTTLKDQNGEQAYPAAFLQAGIKMYQEYQRSLWDINFSGGLDEMPGDDEYFHEYHSHVYGPVGIFLMDIRGHRITEDGIQKSDNPMICEAQWDAFDAFFDNEDLKVIIVASEVPFVGDDPITIQEKAAKVDFLKDHWPYNKDELVRVLDKCFNWKSQNENEREVLLIGGDIHCGVTSEIFDNETDLTIRHVTTSPVTNHVCPYYPDNVGAINERYNYVHNPLGDKYRNYAEIVINFEPSTQVFVNLQRVPTSMFKITDDLSDDEE